MTRHKLEKKVKAHGRIIYFTYRKLPLLIIDCTSLTAFSVGMIRSKYSLGLPCFLSSSPKSHFAETELWYGD